MSVLTNPWIEPVLGLAEVALLLVAVYLTIAQFRRTRASSYIERFNSHEMFDCRLAVDDWLKKYPTTHDRLSALQDDRQLETQLRRFANLFQELGAAYQFGVAHRRTVRVLFDALVVKYWIALRFWIYQYRAETDPTLYSRFEYIYGKLKPRVRQSAPRLTYVVGYGSLMDATSVSAAIGRKVEPDQLIPVIAEGFKRTWTVGELVLAGPDEREVLAAFLDLTATDEARIWAVAFAVSPRELIRLTRRERNYRRVDISSSVTLANGSAFHRGASVVTFLGKEEHKLPAERDGGTLLHEYLDRVLTAARLVHPDLEDEISRSARDADLPSMEGKYCFVDPGQADLV